MAAPVVETWCGLISRRMQVMSRRAGGPHWYCRRGCRQRTSFRYRVPGNEHDQGVPVRSRPAGRPADLRRRGGRRIEIIDRHARRIEFAVKAPESIVQDVQARIAPLLGLN